MSKSRILAYIGLQQTAISSIYEKLNNEECNNETMLELIIGDLFFIKAYNELLRSEVENNE